MVKRPIYIFPRKPTVNQQQPNDSNEKDDTNYKRKGGKANKASKASHQDELTKRGRPGTNQQPRITLANSPSPRRSYSEFSKFKV